MYSMGIIYGLHSYIRIYCLLRTSKEWFLGVPCFVFGCYADRHRHISRARCRLARSRIPHSPKLRWKFKTAYKD